MTYCLRLSIIFVTTMSLCWLIAWLSGYDFDERNMKVAAWAIVSIITSFVVTGWFSLDAPSAKRG